MAKAGTLVTHYCKEKKAVNIITVERCSRAKWQESGAFSKDECPSSEFSIEKFVTSLIV
jgi:hypothetical protein